MAKERRFQKIYQDNGGLSNPITMILVDRETGVNYLYVGNGNAGGLSPLLDANGKPVVTPVSKYDE